MYLSALTTSLSATFEAAVHRLADMSFTHVDVVGMVERPQTHLEALADTPLVVSCAAVGRALPGDHALDAVPLQIRRATVDMVKRQIDDAAVLGATHCYVTSGSDATTDGLMCFTDSCQALAEHARRRMMKFCVEHIPGKALATATAVLDWLSATRDPNLFLLLDIGHCLITEEHSASIIERAGDSLGYVHLDDNDGKSDLHWPLLTGAFRREDLVETLSALKQIGYEGALCLELNAELPLPEESLRLGKKLVEGILVV